MDINVSYDHRTALIVVDVQNDFADPAGERPVRAKRRQLRNSWRKWLF